MYNRRGGGERGRRVAGENWHTHKRKSKMLLAMSNQYIESWWGQHSLKTPPKKRLKAEKRKEATIEAGESYWRVSKLTKECVKFMLQLFSLELGQSVRFAFMLNVPHDGPLVRRLGPSKIKSWKTFVFCPPVAIKTQMEEVFRDVVLLKFSQTEIES